MPPAESTAPAIQVGLEYSQRPSFPLLQSTSPPPLISLPGFPGEKGLSGIAFEGFTSQAPSEQNVPSASDG